MCRQLSRVTVRHLCRRSVDRAPCPADRCRPARRLWRAAGEFVRRLADESVTGHRPSVLDMGCGKGGDMLKWKKVRTAVGMRGLGKLPVIEWCLECSKYLRFRMLSYIYTLLSFGHVGYLIGMRKAVQHFFFNFQGMTN